MGSQESTTPAPAVEGLRAFPSVIAHPGTTFRSGCDTDLDTPTGWLIARDKRGGHFTFASPDVDTLLALADAAQQAAHELRIEHVRARNRAAAPALTDALIELLAANLADDELVGETTEPAA